MLVNLRVLIVLHLNIAAAECKKLKLQKEARKTSKEKKS